MQRIINYIRNYSNFQSEYYLSDQKEIIKNEEAKQNKYNTKEAKEEEKKKKGFVKVSTEQQKKAYREEYLSDEDFMRNSRMESIASVLRMQKILKSSKVELLPKEQILFHEKYLARVRRETKENYEKLLPPPEAKLSEMDKLNKKNN
jgi:hypothetical protein